MGNKIYLRKLDRYKKSNLQAFNVRRPHRYDSSFWVHFWTARWDQEILSELPSNIDSLRILDVGCATGRLLNSLAEAGGQQLAGVDLAPKILEVAHQKLSEAKITADLKAADAEDTLPWSSDYFDIVIMTGVLHHFFCPTKVIREIHRVLRKKGRFLVIEPWLPPPIRQIINLWLYFVPRDGDCHYYSPSEASKIFSSFGFSHFRQRRVATHSFLIVCSKHP